MLPPGGRGFVCDHIARKCYQSRLLGSHEGTDGGFGGVAVGGIVLPVQVGELQYAEASVGEPQLRLPCADALFIRATGGASRQ